MRKVRCVQRVGCLENHLWAFIYALVAKYWRIAVSVVYFSCLSKARCVPGGVTPERKIHATPCFDPYRSVMSMWIQNANFWGVRHMHSKVTCTIAAGKKDGFKLWSCATEKFWPEPPSACCFCVIGRQGRFINFWRMRNGRTVGIGAGGWPS